ncbi:MAG TPA: transferrin-binding protein-like solute binding protein [Stellaceae bacterium]|nr:transferrin-binding protein-like solute binding protein [Stellaceae bacterium]
MGGIQGLLRWFATSFALAGLAACGGGGGGGGGSSAMAVPPPPATATFTPSQNSLSFANNAFTSASSDSDGGQITLTADAMGRARFITLNIPLRGAASYNHTFDLSTAVLGTGSFAGFALVRDGGTLPDGSMPNNLILDLDPNLSFSVYGLWLNVRSADASGHETGAVGGVAFGNLTPIGSLPTAGTATYTGRTIGAAITGTSSSFLTGTVSLSADFTHMTIGGSFNINAVTGPTSTTPWGSFTLPSTGIVATGGSYTYGGINNLTGTIPGGALTGSSLNGHFYGPTGEETAGTWSVSSSTTQAVGAFGAKRQ